MAGIPSVKEILEKDLFELLGIEKASDEQKQALLISMINTVDARVANRVASFLSDDDAERFQQLANDGDSDGLVDFLVKKGIDLPQIVSEEVTRYRVEVAQLLSLVEKED